MRSEKPMKPVVLWPGGKRRLAPEIIKRLPKHFCYVEPFGGGLAVLLAKQRSSIEVVNDINSDLVRLFRVARYHLDPLWDELELILNSREEFEDFLEQPGLTDIQRAARWFVRNQISFGGHGRTFGTGKKSGGASRGSREAHLAALRALNGRLDKVCIENRPWQNILERFDGPETCFFCDPPYVGGVIRYEHASRWKEEDHRELRDALAGADGKWVLTYDDAPLIRELYAGCRFERFERAKGINNRAGSPKRMAELIIRP